MFFARAGLVTLATLVLAIWAVAAPRVVSPNPEQPSAAASGPAPKPLRVPIRSFRSAEPSISNASNLPKNALGPYSSGAESAQARVFQQATTNRVVYSIVDSSAPAVLKQARRVASGSSKTTTNSTPAATATTPVATPVTAPVATPATSPISKPVTAPVTKPVTAPISTPITTTPTKATPTKTAPTWTKPAPPVPPPTKATPTKTAPTWTKPAPPVPPPTKTTPANPYGHGPTGKAPTGPDASSAGEHTEHSHGDGCRRDHRSM
jgi:hypothetical protein